MLTIWKYIMRSVYDIPLSIILFSTILLTPFYLLTEQIKMEIGAESAILINADSGAILFAKDPYSLQYPASTTKIATALYALQTAGNDLDQVVTADQESLVSLNQEGKRKSGYSKPAYWLEPDGSHIGLKTSEQMSLRELLFGMLIASGNDAANVIAQSVGKGSVATFIQQVNICLKEVGCTQTLYVNPHGLHHPLHQTTAYDLSLMTKKALTYPLFREIVSTVRFTRPKTNLQKATTLLQTNKLLRPGKLYYSKAIGVKTGYHSLAKHTFVGAAQSGNRTLIVVLLKNVDRTKMFEDAIKLFEVAFNQPKVQRILLKEGVQKWTKNFSVADQPLQTQLKNAISITYYPAEDPEPRCMLYWKELTLPIDKGSQVGELAFVSNAGEELQRVPIFAYNQVDFKWPFGFLASLKSFVFAHTFISSLLFVACIAALILGGWKLFQR